LKQSPKLPAEKRRAQLIEAAMKVISQKGYAKATTEAIARRAGLTKGALYFHFDTKKDIFFAVVKNLSEKHLEIVTRPLASEPNPLKAIEKMIYAGFELVENRKYFNLEFWQQANRVKRINAYLEQQHRRFEKTLVAFLKKNFKMNKRKSQSLYLLLHVLFDGLVVRYQCSPASVNIPRLRNDVIEMTKLFLHRR